MYLITTVVLFIALLAIIFLNFVIIYQLIQCFQGLLDATCVNFRFTQLVLLGLSLGIGFCIFVLFGLFLAMVVRLSQTYARNDLYNGQY